MMGLTDMIPGVGTLKAVLVAALLTSAISTGVGVERFFAGKRKGVEQERQRGDAVMARVVAQHQASVDAANTRADAQGEEWQLKRKAAEHAQEQERKRFGVVGARLAAVVAERDRLHDSLAAYAAGGVEAGADTAAACRERAAALGDVLGAMVRGYAQCTAQAEDLAAGHRALRSAWPVRGVD